MWTINSRTSSRIVGSGQMPGGVGRFSIQHLMATASSMTESLGPVVQRKDKIPSWAWQQIPAPQTLPT